ncbi:Uncharacterized protein DAT39_021270, partial [Clarias magur]
NSHKGEERLSTYTLTETHLAATDGLTKGRWHRLETVTDVFVNPASAGLHSGELKWLWRHPGACYSSE